MQTWSIQRELLTNLMKSMESDKEITVNVQGLLGYLAMTHLKLTENQTLVGSRFIYEKVSYKVVKKIEHDVEYPIIYVIALDIFV